MGAQLSELTICITNLFALRSGMGAYKMVSVCKEGDCNLLTSIVQVNN
jgi:hypothetical protein